MAPTQRPGSSWPGPSTWSWLPLFCMLLTATLLASLPAGSDAIDLGSKYPKCPLTGKHPTKQKDAGTRCVDASDYTCCSKCTDTRIALGLVSANFSDFVQWAGLPPIAINLLNSQINGTDVNMCTLFNYVDKPTQKATSTCENYIEQLACAMACNPNAGDFVKKRSSGEYELTVCLRFHLSLFDACGLIQVPGGNGGTLAQYIPYAPQMTNDMGTVAWGLSGLPPFRVVFSQATGPPGCWPGPPDLLPEPACCSTLPTGQCSNSTLGLRKRPYLESFANDQNASVSCRVVAPVTGQGNITLFSPPPPRKKSPPQIISLKRPPPQAPSPEAEPPAPTPAPAPKAAGCAFMYTPLNALFLQLLGLLITLTL